MGFFIVRTRRFRGLFDQILQWNADEIIIKYLDVYGTQGYAGGKYDNFPVDRQNLNKVKYEALLRAEYE